LFEESFNVPAGKQSNRRAYQNTAVQFLTMAGDLKGAMAAFDRMEAPPKELAGQANQDFRDFALSRMLPAVLNADRRAGLRWAVQAIANLGQGAYPYNSSVPVIEELLKDDPPLAEALYAQGIESFTKSEGKDWLDRQYFVNFLLKLSGQFKGELEKHAVNLAVDALQNAKPLPNRRDTVHLKLKNGSSTQMGSLDELLLYKLLPLLARYDPERAAGIREGRESFAAALDEGGAITDEHAIVVYGNPDDPVAKLDGVAQRELDWQAGDKAAQLASKDLDQAADQIAGIENIGARAGALAGMAAAIAKEQPAKATSLVDEALLLLEKVKEPDQRLRVLGRVLRAEDRLGETSKAAKLYSELLDLGQEVITKEKKAHPEFIVMGQLGYSYLADATAIMAKRNLETTVAQLARLEPYALVAHLTIGAARTALEQRAQ
jgi:hypothetical protein